MCFKVRCFNTAQRLQFVHKEGVYFQFAVGTFIPYMNVARAKVRRQGNNHRVYFNPITSSSVRPEEKDLVTMHIDTDIPKIGASLVVVRLSRLKRNSVICNATLLAIADKSGELGN